MGARGGGFLYDVVSPWGQGPTVARGRRGAVQKPAAPRARAAQRNPRENSRKTIVLLFILLRLFTAAWIQSIRRTHAFEEILLPFFRWKWQTAILCVCELERVAMTWNAPRHAINPRPGVGPGAEGSTTFFGTRADQCDTGNEAHFGSGTKLTVLEPDRNVTKPTVEVFPPSANECTDQQAGESKKTLVCVASGFYPDHVTVSWLVDGMPDRGVVTTDHSALRTGDDYQITSRLRVEAKLWYTAGASFQCIISFFDGTETTKHPAMVYGDPAGQPHLDYMTREKYMRVTQAAKLSYGVFIIKNIIYGIFVMILAWKLGLGRSAEK